MKYFAILVLFFSTIHCGRAQVRIMNQNGLLSATPEMYMRVKQFDEFIKRFNYERDWYNKSITDSFRQAVPRKQYLQLLFDLNDSRIDTTSTTFSADYVHHIAFWTQKVVEDSIMLQKNYRNIYAQAVCDVKYKNVPQQITLTLQMRITPDNAMRWEIAGVDSKWLNWDDNINGQKTIPPNSHETQFIGMRTLLKNHYDYKKLTSSVFQPNPLTAFFDRLYSGSLKFQHVKQVMFHVTEVDGWVFTVREFNRESYNSGWLIDNLLPVDDKTTYLHNVLHIIGAE